MGKMKFKSTVEHTYKYKGKSILQKRNWSFTSMRWLQEYFVIGGGPFEHYKTLANAKKAIDAWEHKQFKRDKPKGWEK
jgi:hypothetical protein